MKTKYVKQRLIDSIRASAFGLTNQIIKLKKEHNLDIKGEILQYMKEKLN